MRVVFEERPHYASFLDELGLTESDLPALLEAEQ